MSVQSSQRQVESVQRELDLLHRQLNKETSKESQKAKRLASIIRSISSSKSPTTVRNKQREAERLEREIVAIKVNKANIQKKIAAKTEKLHRHQNEVEKARSREQKKLRDSLSRTHHDQLAVPRTAISRISQSVSPAVDEPDHDAFISHASEDKEVLVRPLATALQEAGCDIWYDEFALTVGDSLRRSIDRGLANSRFGIVVLSPSFFAKQWTEYELDGLVAKEMEGGKVILPLWHNISKDQVLKYSPTLADKMALSTAMFTIDELAEKLHGAISDAG